MLFTPAECETARGCLECKNDSRCPLRLSERHRAVWGCARQRLLRLKGVGALHNDVTRAAAEAAAREHDRIRSAAIASDTRCLVSSEAVDDEPIGRIRKIKRREEEPRQRHALTARPLKREAEINGRTGPHLELAKCTFASTVPTIGLSRVASHGTCRPHDQVERCTAEDANIGVAHLLIARIRPDTTKLRWGVEIRESRVRRGTEQRAKRRD